MYLSHQRQHQGSEMRAAVTKPMKTSFLCTCSSVDWPPHPWAHQGSDPAPTCSPGSLSRYPTSTPLASPSISRSQSSLKTTPGSSPKADQ
uniref:Uncharacterized protein n=1 Tax=Arundo donax TaxID=35708 RepID=A0A0A9F241_ARUDO